MQSKKSLKHRTGEASRLQAATQPQSPLQLVRNSQTPDGAVARASLLDHSKILRKKLLGQREAITHYKNYPGEKTARKRVSLFGHLHAKVKRFDQKS